MRLLYVVHQFMPDFVGGTELDTWEIASAMRNRGHTVSIVHRAQGNAGWVRTERQGIPVHRLECGPMTPTALFAASYGHRRLSRAFRAALAEVAPDLVHVQHLRGLPTGLVGQVKAQGLPMVLTLHDFWFVCPNAQLIDNVTGKVCTTPGEPIHCARCALARAGLRSALPAAPLLAPLMAARNSSLRRVVRRADVVLVYSEFVRRWFAGRGVPTDKMHLMVRGISRPEVLPTRGRATGGSVRFVYIGGLAWQKGVHTVVEAFNSLPDAGELIIAGDETQDPGYAARLRALADHPGIRFVGRLDRPAVWQTLAEADAVVVPSLWYETYSLLTREAFAMGVPVFASAHGALADAVVHQRDGLLVPPGDVAAWRRALGDFVASSDMRARLMDGVSPPPTMEGFFDSLESTYAGLQC